ncbi:MAG TPA: glycosyltransferase family 4 protein [Ktedonobacterales bacterium]|nr:glycosyltransferase family 4 protein [Ktedonobacterales bacterium]
MVRVAVVSKTFVAEASQQVLERIAAHPGVELTLITPPEWRSDDGRTLPFVPRYTAGYAVRPTPVVFNGRYHFYIYRGLSRVMRQLQPDIVHIDEEPYNPAGAQAQRAALVVGARTIFVALQNLYKDYPFPYSAMEQYSYRHMAHMIAVNAAAGEVARRKGYAGPLSVFTVYGIDPDTFQPALRREPRPAPDTFIIGYLGRLTLYKGTGLLIEALASMPARFRLRFIGSGPDEPELRHLVAQHGVADRVEFRAAVPTDAVPAALAEVDALAVPSLTQANWMEQFGRVLIEAMACGTPVVGSDSGEIPNVIGDAGLIVPEGDVAALRDALLRLEADPALRARLSQMGRERALRLYTNDAAARNVVAVYQQTLGAVLHAARPSS